MAWMNCDFKGGQGKNMMVACIYKKESDASARGLFMGREMRFSTQRFILNKFLTARRNAPMDTTPFQWLIYTLP